MVSMGAQMVVDRSIRADKAIRGSENKGDHHAGRSVEKAGTSPRRGKGKAGRTEDGGRSESN
jgi:hypothetical protein